MTKDRNDGRFTRMLKWIGYLTAIFSLCGTLAAITKYLYDRAEARRNVATLLTVETEEEKAHDYTAGWLTLEKAIRLEPTSDRVRAAQEGLALAWLEDVHLKESQKFSDITGKIEPILERAIASAKPGPRQADLRAHIGWAYFLESRDGRFDLDPTGPYRDAVMEDPDNPYAQAMWGHWILWQNCDQIQEAEGHFAAALASGREGDYVRRLEMAALLNCHTHGSDLEVIRVANAMRKERRTLDDSMRDHILGIYYFEFTPKTAETSEFIDAVSPAEHLATFRWLFDTPNSDEGNKASQSYYLAGLEEAAGHSEDALADYRLALRQMSPDSTQGKAADAGAKRLSRLH